MPTRERMESVDAAWLRMDDDTQRMVITVVLRFAGWLAFERFEELVQSRVVHHPRFRQRVVESMLPGAGPSWEDDPHFALGRHVHRCGLPEPRDEAALLALVADLASTALDVRTPLWQMHVVEDAPGGTAVVARLHHAIGDGVSLVRFLLSLTDECTDAAPAVVGLALDAKPHPLLEQAGIVVDHALTLARLVALPSEHASRLRGELGRDKRVAVSPPFPLAALKAAGRRHGATLNDVLLTLVGGGLGRYLAQHGDATDALELRAMVPVFFRGHGDTAALGNHFGLVFAPLLVGIADPATRLGEVKRRMDAVKSSPEALVALETLRLMGLAGQHAERVGIEIFTSKASAMITNVPGPPSTLHLAGTELADLLVWAPVAGHIGLGITLVTYAGHLRVAVFSDARRVPDPERLVAAIADELAALVGS